MDYISGATISEQKEEWMLNQLKGPPGKALDLGCGAGFYSQKLVDLGWQVEALDLDPITSIKGVQVHKHNLEQGLPYQDSEFNLILAWDVLEHVKNESALWNDISRTLKNGGILLGSVPHASNEKLYKYNLTFKHHIDKTHQREYNVSDIEKRLTDYGLRKLNIDRKGPVPPGFISEFIPFTWARMPVRKIVGAARRVGLLNFGGFYADVFFAAQKI